MSCEKQTDGLSNKFDIKFDFIIMTFHCPWFTFICKNWLLDPKDYWVLSHWAECGVVGVRSPGEINSLWPSVTIWWQEMACCLMAQSHYQNQCWLLISQILWHSYENNFAVSAQSTIPYNEFENSIFRITPTSPRGQGLTRRLWVSQPVSPLSPHKGGTHSDPCTHKTKIPGKMTSEQLLQIMANLIFYWLLKPFHWTSTIRLNKKTLQG